MTHASYVLLCLAVASLAVLQRPLGWVPFGVVVFALLLYLLAGTLGIPR